MNESDIKKIREEVAAGKIIPVSMEMTSHLCRHVTALLDEVERLQKEQSVVYQIFIVHEDQ